MTEVLTISQIAELGEKIYEKHLKKEYEGKHDNKFLAIDVTTKRGYLGEHPEIALGNAKENNPNGHFYLKRIGDSATFHVSYLREMDVEGILQSV